MFRGAVVMHWSKTQANVALSSAEAELNASVKGLSELIGIHNLISETLGVQTNLALCTDASACKGMLLRHGTGKVKHLSVKQLWSQEVVGCYNVQVHRVAREANPADMLTHSVTFPIAEKQLAAVNFERRKMAEGCVCPGVLHVQAPKVPVGALCTLSPQTGAESEGGCGSAHPLRHFVKPHTCATSGTVGIQYRQLADNMWHKTSEAAVLPDVRVGVWLKEKAAIHACKMGPDFFARKWSNFHQKMGPLTPIRNCGVYWFYSFRNPQKIQP